VAEECSCNGIKILSLTYVISCCSMADCFSETDQRPRVAYRSSTYGSALKRSTHRESLDNDLSSMYTAKSGTPLLYKMRGVSEDAISDFSLSITPRTRTTMAWDSILREDNGFIGEDSTSFCKKYNMRQCLISLSQVCIFSCYTTEFSIHFH